jgi:hypothetical protein
MHSMGFEPTSTNTVELESTALDRSATNASHASLQNKQFTNSLVLNKQVTGTIVYIK